MIETKLYLYDSSKTDYKGEDLSKYILAGDTSVDTLNEELGTVTLTLAGYPTRTEFAPSTKMIYEKWQDGVKYFSWSIVVNSDAVDQPVMANDNYFDHHIDFFEASAIAQGRIVDNISVTYKLKDVTLDDEMVVPNPDAVAVVVENEISNANGNLPNSGAYSASQRKTSSTWTDDYKLSQSIQFLWENDTAYNIKYYNKLDGQVVKKLTLPQLVAYIQNGLTDAGEPTYRRLGEVSYDIKVVEENLQTHDKVSILNKTKHPTERWSLLYNNFFLDSPNTPALTMADGYILNDLIKINNGKDVQFLSKKLADFVETPLTEIEYTIKPNCKYYITFVPHNFQNQVAGDTVSTYDNGAISFYNDTSLTWHYVGNIVKGYRNNSRVVDNLTFGIEFMTYKAGDKKTFSHSAPPVSCYDLFIKSQIASQELVKDANVSIVDQPLTFYTSPEDTAMLKATAIIENMYHQKNLWEMFLEIGKYIHCIPRIVFGKDDRYLVKWEKLGKNEQKPLYGNKVTIYNNRALENYVSACSSYITNAVQIGGVVEEYIYPKTTDESYLVSNNSVKLIVSKPIIEVLDLTAILINNPNSRYQYKDSGGSVVDIPRYSKATLSGHQSGFVGFGIDYSNGFIFAKEVYDLFAISESQPVGSTELNPLTINKGRAIWYQQGSNEIQGLTYRLPSVNAGDDTQQYAIKRILQLAYGIVGTSWWDNIYINDFAFKIRYRTKDGLRSEQSRPDLRKYLLNSNYDDVPQHKQFNNQEDIVVDTRKLGNNIYGKLIKTGNTEFTMTQWYDNLEELPNSGDFVKIYDNLYYVAKVTNVYYANHVMSEVKLTKDYNQLSEIIGIPSEPRFYEISEQSSIKRDICFNKYLALGSRVYTDTNPSYKLSAKGREWITGMLTGRIPQVGGPTNVVTIFKNDAKHLTGDIPNNELYKAYIYSTLSRYVLHNTLTFQWDMVDNFSAGDQIDLNVKNPPVKGKQIDDAYVGILPVRYKDVYGRIDMVDFMIVDNDKVTADVVAYKTLPEIAEAQTESMLGDTFFSSSVDEFNYKSNNHGMAVLLDNREIFKGNFNLQMLTDSDRFVLSSYLWQDVKSYDIRVALLSEEVNKIVNDTLPTNTIIKTTSINRNFATATDSAIRLHIGDWLHNDTNLDNVKAIAIIDAKLPPYANPFNPNETYFVMARNVDGLTDAEKRGDWYVSFNIDKTFFKKQ